LQSTGDKLNRSRPNDRRPHLRKCIKRFFGVALLGRRRPTHAEFDNISSKTVGCATLILNPHESSGPTLN
jgi:hypothetical protein